MGETLPLDFTADDYSFSFLFADVVFAHHARTLFVMYMAGQLPAESDLFGVELVFGELIGNVARHAPGPVEVRVLWTGGGARLEVWDHGPGYELNVKLPDDVLAESRRGLFLVTLYADDLLVERREERTVTSVQLRVHRALVCPAALENST